MRRVVSVLLIGVVTALMGLSNPAGAASTDQSAACIQKLHVIFTALQSYQRDQHRLPGQLSDLVPKYLPDKEALHCPDDDDSGFIGYGSAHKDPRMPIS